MRLDHLLSRDLGACEGAGGARGRVPWVLSWPVGGAGQADGTGARSLACVCWCPCAGAGGWGWGVPASPVVGGVGACCRGLGLRALCVLLLLPPVVWGVVGVWVGWL